MQKDKVTDMDNGDNECTVPQSELIERLGTHVGYSCWQLLTVKQIVSVNSIDGCIPVILLPKSLIGKTVKVTVEECA